jgi:hypothetical protein
MTVTFELPNTTEELLRRETVDLDRAAKEAALVEFYRQGKLTHHELAIALGLDRLETESVLKRHGVTEDCVTAEELGAQLTALRNLVGA